MIAARYPALARFLAYYRPHKGLFMLDFSCAVMSGLLELSFPLAVRGFIDILLPTGQWLWTFSTPP
jgi:ATP-binding cassette subfamily B protein